MDVRDGLAFVAQGRWHPHGQDRRPTLITLIGSDMVSIIQLDWAQMMAVTATTMVLSALTSIAGLPEVDDGKSPISTR